MSEPIGVVKLVGISGFVKGETFTIRQGESVSIGRSRSCSFSLRDCKAYQKVDPLGTKVNEHFKTVSREHVVIQLKGANEVLIHDGSANGTFIDGKRIGKTALIKNLPSAAHDLKLGTNESFRVEWRNLVKRRKIRIVKVPEGKKPPEGAVEITEAEALRIAGEDEAGRPERSVKADQAEPAASAPKPGEAGKKGNAGAGKAAAAKTAKAKAGETASAKAKAEKPSAKGSAADKATAPTAAGTRAKKRPPLTRATSRTRSKPAPKGSARRLGRKR